MGWMGRMGRVKNKGSGFGHRLVMQIGFDFHKISSGIIPQKKNFLHGTMCTDYQEYKEVDT
jgi:hypothetical protein